MQALWELFECSSLDRKMYPEGRLIFWELFECSSWHQNTCPAAVLIPELILSELDGKDHWEW